MNNTDEVTLMAFHNVDARHLANFLPVVEEDIDRVTVVHILEGNNVITKFGTKVTRVHTLATNVFSGMHTIEDIATFLILTLTFR